MKALRGVPYVAVNYTTSANHFDLVKMKGGRGNDTYIVEKIVDKKVENGVEKFFVKWLGWSSKTNTWEPREHLAECEDLIEEFESRKTPSKRGSKGFVKRKSSKGAATPNGNVSLNTSASTAKPKNVAGVELDDIENETTNGSKGPKNKKRNSEKVGFARGLTPLEIVGAVENNGTYCFLIKWEGSDETDIVPAIDAHKFCPQLVIQFYEKRIMWKPVTK
ncbi:chromobox protein homolog 1-like [Planococcus citri]|uniref:chromobox protein homolog 1-like n=1 Tax=Planococcus citri TaxID=170843 RepID=UPI0031FA2EBC